MTKQEPSNLPIEGFILEESLVFHHRRNQLVNRLLF